MYAVIRTGGKQYRVQAGDSIRVEKLDRELGAEFDLTDILMVGGDTTVIGQPVVKNAAVTVVVTKQTRDSKVLVFKKKRRQGYRRLKGHRQYFTELFIKAISLDGKETKSDSDAKVIDVERVRKAKIAARSVKKEKVLSSPESEIEELFESVQSFKKPVKTKKKIGAKSPAKKKTSGKSRTRTAKKPRGKVGSDKGPVQWSSRGRKKATEKKS